MAKTNLLYIFIIFIFFILKVHTTFALAPNDVSGQFDLPHPSQNQHLKSIITAPSFQKDMKALIDMAIKYYDPHPDLAYHHGLNHALVVVNHALTMLSITNPTANKATVYEIVIAALFHESGMTITTNRIHGQESRVETLKVIYELKRVGFLSSLNGASIARIGQAVYLHDQKEHAVEKNFVSQIIFDADNVDAFGTFGIYRYLAIYKKRGWSLDEIKSGKEDNFPLHKNVKKRFELLTPELKPNYMEEYKKTHSFFSALDNPDSWQSLVTSVFLAIDKSESLPLDKLFSKWEAEALTRAPQFTAKINHFFKQLNADFSLDPNTIAWAHLCFRSTEKEREDIPALSLLYCA